jgi:hypothetical protein
MMTVTVSTIMINTLLFISKWEAFARKSNTYSNNISFQLLEYKHINAFEHKCCRRALKISWTEQKNKQSIQQELQIHESWLPKQIEQQEMKYFGYINTMKVRRSESLKGIYQEGGGGGDQKGDVFRI